MPDARREPPAAAVLVVGGSNLDLQATGAQPLLAGDSTPGRIVASAGGVARNIAERLARGGCPVRLVSVLGDDEAGRWLRSHGEQAGIDMGGCAVLAGAATARYLSLHQPDGELFAAINDMALLDRLDAALLAAEAPWLRQAATLVIEANLAPATLDALWPLLGREAPPVWADPVSVPKSLRLAPHLHRLHTLKPNRAEAAALTGLAVDAAPQALADALLDRGLSQVALSLGEQGLWLARREAHGQRLHHAQPALPVAVHSVTGAGDALLAGLLLAQRQGLGLADAAARAVAAAAAALAAPA